jgi:uncharacterized protein YodC (DUF2158 family)
MPGFKVGDTVRLKSGGQIMTISSIIDGCAKCLWNYDGDDREQTYLLEVIEPASIIKPGVYRLDRG